ncbi:TonB family protein [Litoribacillus peritrichatus]|uniref:Protein TonB n=1 Tax=Litoribacillus peritrichatus TaxID=718191 RepID=A0ABP7MK69_9GAMM
MRALWFFPAALLVVIGLFMFMAQLAGSGKQYQMKKEDALSLNMLRMRFDSDVQLREREPPPPPPVIQPDSTPQPPMPKAMSAPKMDMPKIDVPDVSFDSSFKIEATPPSVPVMAAPTDLVNELSLEMAQMPKKRVNPQYPRRALQRKVTGKLLVEFIVDVEGRVEMDSIVFLEAEPKGVFERTVRKSLARWRFNPLVRDGQAVRFKSRQPFNFTLSK